MHTAVQLGNRELTIKALRRVQQSANEKNTPKLAGTKTKKNAPFDLGSALLPLESHPSSQFEVILPEFPLKGSHHTKPTATCTAD